jgi:photosystem II stability/assembly factor-like uncharacterized protein
MKVNLSLAIVILLLCFSITEAFSQAWVSQNSGTSSELRSVSFVDTLIGVAVGHNGTVRRTTNGGTNWFAQNPGTSSNLRCVTMLNSNTGYVVGYTGAIRKTTNGGTNWFSLASGLTNNLNSVNFVNLNTGYIAGTNGLILKTTDAGINWIIQSSGTTNEFNSIDFIDPSTGYIVGFNKTVRKTTNGGINWFALPSLPPSILTELTSVSFIDANTGTITKGNLNGDRLVFRTTNGGINWVAQDLGSVHSLRWISFHDNNIGTIVGDEGDVFRTTNGGQSWTMQPTGLLTWFFGASFVTPNSGWMVGQNGSIYKTSTGGANVPNAPSNLVGFAISTSKIFLAWFDNSTNEQGFRIERRVNSSGSFSLVGTTGPNTLNYIDTVGISPGNLYEYRVAAFSGSTQSSYTNIVAILVTGIEPTGTDIPNKYTLYNNYPNPFNPTTKVKFDLPKNDFVSLKIYNMQGQEVGVLVQENLSAGRYELEFNGANLTSGVYFYRLETSSFTDTRKMILIK